MTGFSENEISPRRGRPSGLSDLQLQNRRDQFVQIFEGGWGDIEWELQRCKKAEDLIRIITPIASPTSWVHERLSIFCRESSESSSGTALRKLRRECAAIVKPYRLADEAARWAHEQLEQVKRALYRAPKKSYRIVKRARKAKRKQYWRAAQEYRNLRDRDNRLCMRLRQAEASFARAELFRFLKSKRYALTPANLGAAAAGLPYMGYRQSIRRTRKLARQVTVGSHYQIFKAVRYLVNTANKRTEKALVISFREGIPALPSRYRLPKEELAAKWLYFERAVRQAYRAKPHPRALVGEITRRYFNQTRLHSEVDQILADQAKLRLHHRPTQQDRRDDKIAEATT